MNFRPPAAQSIHPRLGRLGRQNPDRGIDRAGRWAQARADSGGGPGLKATRRPMLRCPIPRSVWSAAAVWSWARMTGGEISASPADIVQASGQVGAFPLVAGEHDSALVLTLPPGSYNLPDHVDQRAGRHRAGRELRPGAAGESEYPLHQSLDPRAGWHRRECLESPA